MWSGEARIAAHIPGFGPSAFPLTAIGTHVFGVRNQAVVDYDVANDTLHVLGQGRSVFATADHTALFVLIDDTHLEQWALDGTVIGRNMQRHRHQEFIRFLNAVEAEVPASKAVHVILDNYAAHKHPKVRQWLDRHERFTFHFTPTSCSWLNAVEGFFATLTKRRLKRGVFHSIFDLQASINRFLKEHNMQPKPFVWTADPDKIIAAVGRGHQMLDSIH